ncbi:uncharacterized protein LOC117517019 isoform X2 [Thalassophryne amazonica]|uniref:uncharacterized protein LOC117517019 isoform X2 n=1 Tax=Thalassophryne amazonica TaxID=390379 RepID=UPI001470B4A5|nr:uncharacterized protein LOC117517019 isoform X2 [Thalassophryne amazonica]
MRCSQFGEFHHLLQELHLDDGRFQWYFRLSRTQFEDLLSCIGATIRLQDTNYRRSIPAAERLFICLRYLATGDSYRTIADSFRVGVSTVSIIVPRVVTAIWDSLRQSFMAVLTTEDWRSIAQEFYLRWQFPLCCGDAFQKVIEIFGQISIMCNNAGIVNEAQWEKTIAINLVRLITPVNLYQVSAPLFM